jgi:hypothetical protein
MWTIFCSNCWSWNDFFCGVCYFVTFRFCLLFMFSIYKGFWLLNWSGRDVIWVVRNFLDELWKTTKIPIQYNWFPWRDTKPENWVSTTRTRNSVIQDFFPCLIQYLLYQKNLKCLCLSSTEWRNIPVFLKLRYIRGPFSNQTNAFHILKI